MSPREIIDETLRVSGRGTLAELEARALARLPAAVRDAAFPRRLRLIPTASSISAPTGRNVPTTTTACAAPGATCPPCPTIGRSTKPPTAAHPFKLATSPARNFLNSSFNQTATSPPRERRPTALMHPDDAAALGLGEGDVVRLGNARGSIRLHARLFAGRDARRASSARAFGTTATFLDGRGINTLTGDDSVAPFGGAAFHDVRVWARAEGAAAAGVNAVAEADGSPFLNADGETYPAGCPVTSPW